jgi:biopolymer transport protein TolR
MGKSKSKGRKDSVQSEPNVVPLCDVLLVLLIIFMIVTPLVKKGVDVKLPSAQYAINLPESSDLVVLTIKKEPRDPKGFVLFVKQDKVTLENLQNALEEAFLTVSEHKLYLRVDQDLEYGILTENILNIIAAAGIENVGIITDKKAE